MNRLHPYSAFLFALLTGSAFLVAALSARPVPSAGGDSEPEKARSGGEEILVALASDSGADRQVAGIHLRYGMARWWAPDGLRQEVGTGGLFSGAASLSALMLDPGAGSLVKSGQPRKPGAVPATGREEVAVDLSAGQPFHDNARKIKKYVDCHAARFRIKPNLVFAIIKAESSFDAKAASAASAHGLMQLVPEAGGRAAYKMVYGKDAAPSREYLQDPDNNIELGTAYLRHLAQEYFDAVENADSREYCLIAAYNTGPANVYRAFGGGYGQAMDKINSLSPPEVYDHLRSHLPYAETRNYLSKVVSARSEFITL